MAKKIVLFADGTGNAFSTQESNVWRMFDALDTSKKDQIAVYIEGVGTSSFRPWAIFDGATGIGAPANIRKLYRFLCWDWERGDEIYMFGFSRGVVPIMARNLRNLILSLKRIIPFNWRHRRYDARGWKAKDATAKLDTVVNVTRLQGRSGERIEIKFVGLFDTVEAFGVPLENLRSAIDSLIWPVSFPIEDMSQKVWRVRHALSLDDERTTFHPIRIKRAKITEKSTTENLLASDWVKKLLFKVQRVSSLPEARPMEAAEDTERVREVWFAGVHSDVGGGYPDDQLAHIPLVWMLEEVQKADNEYAEIYGKDDDKEKPGLRFRHGANDEFRAVASPFGTLHDSRAGKGFFYRYSPRNVAEMLVGKDAKVTHDVVVHHTVVSRMLYGSDNYAPIVLSPDAQVLRSDAGMERLQGYIKNRATEEAADHKTYQWNRERLLDKVWERQFYYFAMLATLLLLLFIPLWESLIDPLSVAAGVSDLFVKDGGSAAINLFGSFVGALKSVMPSYFAPYLESLHYHPFVIIVLIFLSTGFYIKGNALRDDIRERARNIWKPSIGVPQSIEMEALVEPRFRIIRLMRNFKKQKVRPGQIAGKLAVVVGFIFVLGVGVIGLSRLVFNLQMGGGRICTPTEPNDIRWFGSKESISVSEMSSEAFRTKYPCWASKIGVEKGVAYRLRIDINPSDLWFDRDVMTDVGGFENDGLLRKVFKWPLLRWPSAGWFQPIARIGARGDTEWPIVANDGSGPIPQDAGQCKLMPRSYLDTPEFCDAHKPLPCADARKKLENEMGASEQLPESEMASASKAWLQTEGKWHINAFKRANCQSSYPRMTLVSDFVAKKTGPLFLFVNDAMPLIFMPTDKHYFVFMPTDKYYSNNRGSAKITLSRLQPSDSESIVSHREP
jgi:uncharacterized protein (DUF2235 family)